MCLPTLLIRPSHTQCVSFVQDSLLLSLFQGFTRQCSTSSVCMLTSQRTRTLWKGYQSMLYFLLLLISPHWPTQAMPQQDVT